MSQLIQEMKMMIQIYKSTLLSDLIYSLFIFFVYSIFILNKIKLIILYIKINQLIPNSFNFEFNT